MTKGRSRLLELGLALTLFAAVSVTSAVLQQRTQLNKGIGWDGCSYYSMAAQILEGKRPQGPSPFIYRIGTPALAALLGARDLLNGFLTANIIASALLTVLMVVWLRRQIDNWIVRLILLAAFLAEWHGPARSVYFYPTTSDPWGMVFCLAGLICIDKLHSRFSRWTLVQLCLICFVGTFFREFVALIGLAAILSADLVSHERGTWFRRPNPSFLLPCGSSLLGMALPHLYVTSAALIPPVSGCEWSYPRDYSFLHNAAHWMYTQPLAMYLHAWLIAFGPILFLLIFGWRESRRFLSEHQYQFVYLAGVAGLAWIGGSDTERYAFYAMPVIYVLVGQVILQKTAVLKSPLLIGFLAITQVISERLFWTIPDFWGASSPNALFIATHPPDPSWFLLNPIGKISYLNLLSRFGGKMSISFVQYLFVGFALLAWLHLRDRRLGSVVSARGTNS